MTAHTSNQLLIGGFCLKHEHQTGNVHSFFFIVLYCYKYLKQYVIVIKDIGFSFQDSLRLKIQIKCC